MRILSPRCLRAVVRFTAWTTLVAILLVSYVPPALRPLSPAPHGVEHFAAFAFLGAIFLLAYPKRMLFLVAVALPFLGALELLQLLAPGRHARLGDFLIDAIGTYAGLLVAAAAINIFASTRRIKVNAGNPNDP